MIVLVVCLVAIAFLLGAYFGVILDGLDEAFAPRDWFRQPRHRIKGER